jgi:uncharacterized repeat protein (TIGR02543 family)
MAVHWGGGTGPRYLFDGNLSSVGASGSAGNRTYSRTEVEKFTGTGTGGGTKKNPVLQADVFGDWREEIILREADNSAFRIYTTSIATQHSGNAAIPPMGIPTLMHDREYRLAVAWQNSGYNQPPHTGFFIGFNMNAQMPIVVFQSDGKAIGRQQVPVNKMLVKPADPTRSGYNFDGWYNGSAVWNFSAGVSQPMTLTAKWAANSSSSSTPSSSSSVEASSSSSSDDVTAMQNIANLQVPEGTAVKYFDLKGNAVHKPFGDLPSGLYIARVGNKAVKVLKR